MNYSRRTLIHVCRLLPLISSLAAAFICATIHAFAAETGSGNLAISVTSAKTHNALQGAAVSLPALHRDEITDDAGNLVIKNLPSGELEVNISYEGFQDERRRVTIVPGAVTRLESALQASDVVTMEKFTVESVKEGQALSITEQRNATNIKNVTAFDEWGILPTQNVGELASRLPGVMIGDQDADQLIMNVSIRGQPSAFTRLNIDGMSSTGVGGDGRTATMHSYSGSMYEEIEIIAAQTPDKRADSLGGQLNLKTRSPLAMSERQRFNYAFSARWFPPWSDRNFAVGERPWRPDLSASYTGVFDVLGGRRNLGVVITAAYQEVLNPHSWDLLLYENTTNAPAQLRDYTKQSGLNDRFISAFSARADYRLSPSTQVSLRFLYNAGSEPFFHYTAMHPFYNGTPTVYDPVTNPKGSIVPGYTQSHIEFRPVATTVLTNNNIGVTQMAMNPQRYSFTSKNPTATLVFEHNWGRLKVDHAYRFSNTHWDSGAGRKREDGTISVRTRDPIGFILDYSNPRGQVFTQTAGPSVADAASYTPYVTANASATQPVPTTSSVVNKRDTITNTNEWSGTVNASYALETRLPITLKTGVDTVNRRVFSRQVYPRRWYQVPGTVLPTSGLMPLTDFEVQNRVRLPVFDPAAISTTLDNPALWYEDVNYTAVQQYSGRYIMEEGVDAAYAQGTMKWGPLTFLTGLRGEWVRIHTLTYFRARTTPIAAELDPFKRAGLDFEKQDGHGQYHKWFPSYHLVYDVTRNLKARASWSTSYGRPRRQDIIPTPVINDQNRTVTIGNAALKPQMAHGIDLKLEYYFKTGMVSVTGYKKRITDYIGNAARSGVLVPSGPDNGFDGLAENYEIIAARNLGDANLKGLELDYRQRLTFLPGILKGLTARANYTYLETYGRFAGTTDLQNGQVAGFLPHAYNLGLLYTYKKFGASWDLSWAGKFPTAYSASATNPNGNVYRKARDIQNVGVTYKLSLRATVFLNLNNIEQTGNEFYTWQPSRPRQSYIVPRTVKFGVTGQF